MISLSWTKTVQNQHKVKDGKALLRFLYLDDEFVDEYGGDLEAVTDQEAIAFAYQVANRGHWPLGEVLESDTGHEVSGEVDLNAMEATIVPEKAS